MAGSICFVVGARPNFVKTAPVVQALRERHADLEVVLVHTGQHYDDSMSDVFFRELGVPQPDVFLGVGSGSHALQTARALERIEAVLLERRPSLVVVPGDVNSTLAGALAAVKLHIPVAHLEAGLRSYDRSMPEEHNRVVADHVSDLLLTHSQSAVDNLIREGIDADRVHLVGNTMIDSLLAAVGRARRLEPWRAVGVAPREYALVTLHRPELVDDPSLLAATSTGLAELASSMPIVFPVHPRTAAHLEQLRLRDEIERAGVRVLDPLGYLEFLGLESEAALVLTDSGGVQEETSVLGVPCFTLRATTERPVTVELGTNTLLGADPSRIPDVVTLLQTVQLRNAQIPLWDGSAGERAADVLAGHVARRRDVVPAG
jgi:UDP-N-acetylglucosamine 2-epimerase (non-hydrolysing)